MHKDIIQKWNDKVQKKDTIYVLGDIIFDISYEDVLAQLQGRKVLILGNHDTGEKKHELLHRHFSRIEGVLPRKNKIVLTHIPVHESQFKRWDLNVHSHLHEKSVMLRNSELKDLRYFNVCLEQNNMMPFHMSQIQERIAILKKWVYTP